MRHCPSNSMWQHVLNQHCMEYTCSKMYGNILQWPLQKCLCAPWYYPQLDCINSILTNTSLTTTKPYQKIQNQTARIIYKKTKWTSATSSMKQLHWLPIRYMCHFKLLTIVYKTLHGMGPAYLRNRLKVKNITRNT